MKNENGIANIVLQPVQTTLQGLLDDSSGPGLFFLHTRWRIPHFLPVSTKLIFINCIR